MTLPSTSHNIFICAIEEFNDQKAEEVDLQKAIVASINDSGPLYVNSSSDDDA